jgi:hypothetical protein
MLIEERQSAGQTVHANASRKEVSPWLQLTRWPEYLAGHSFEQLAALAAMPSLATEPGLFALGQSLDRLVDAAYTSICQDRINVFDQARINSFLQRPRASDRPLMIKLQKATFRKYQAVWKGLLCFVARAADPCQTIRLRHQLQSRQAALLGEVFLQIDRLLQLPAEHESARQSARAAVDDSCLDLCIALLDHDLKGDLFESAVVGFLAVLGIDLGKGNLKEAQNYTPSLSGFIKIAQMLVIEKAIRAADAGDAAQPADLLDDMRERFMIHGTRSPFNWASRLRMYGKRIRDSSTCLGYISWSDDLQSVSYKDVRDLDMEAFRGFIRGQITKAQSLLEELLLMHPDETREHLDVPLRMHHLVDNAVESRRG